MSNKLINTTFVSQLLHFEIKMHNCMSGLKCIKFEHDFDMKLERTANSS